MHPVVFLLVFGFAVAGVRSSPLSVNSTEVDIKSYNSAPVNGTETNTDALEARNSSIASLNETTGNFSEPDVPLNDIISKNASQIQKAVKNHTLSRRDTSAEENATTTTDGSSVFVDVRPGVRFDHFNMEEEAGHFHVEHDGRHEEPENHTHVEPDLTTRTEHEDWRTAELNDTPAHVENETVHLITVPEEITNDSISIVNVTELTPPKEFIFPQPSRESLLAMHPKLSPGLEVEFIRFRSGSSGDWQKYVQDLSNFVEVYDKSLQEKNVHCDFERLPKDSEACRFDLVYLGPSCTKQNSFGYSLGKPCILLSPEKIPHWVPQPFENDTTAVPDEVQRLMRIFNPNFMFVTCEGATDEDKANMGPLAYLPPYQGFPTYYFPYKENVSGYVAPLMAIEFLNPVNGTKINVVCKALARNINDVPYEAQIQLSVQID